MSGMLGRPRERRLRCAGPPRQRATQRNIDEHGRAQARAVGEAFRQHRVPVDKILSSPLCRCLETARLMALGPVESVLAVASSDRSPEGLPALKQMVAD